MSWIGLNGSGASNDECGGKGAALDRLITLSRNVPPTAVITTAVYRRFVQRPEVAAILDELARSDADEVEDHEAERSRIDRAFTEAEPDAELESAVTELLAWMPDGALFAVRSSATAEDRDDASFAGQYQSLLEVEAVDLASAIHAVWASLWHPAPQIYRRRNGIGDDGIAMAVVVMAMVDADTAGVLFTVDPAGQGTTARIEVVEGLGESLVSGEDTPDVHVVERSAVERDAAPIGGAEALQLDPALVELLTSSVQLEEDFGGPLDIEFAVEGGRLWFLQARPITSGPAIVGEGDDVSFGADITYTTAGVGEMLPGYLPPLLWDLNSWAVEEAFRSLFDQLGGDVTDLHQPHRLIARFRGRAALNLDAMKESAASISGGSSEALERQYFGAPPTDLDEQDDSARPTSEGGSNGGNSSGGTMQAVRILRSRSRAALESEIAIETVETLLEREPDATSLDDDALIAFHRRLIALGGRVMAAEVGIAAIASASHRSVERFLARYADPDEAAEATRTILTTDAGARRTRLATQLDELIDRLETRPDRSVLADAEWSEARDLLCENNSDRSLVTEFEQKLARAGSTNVFAGPTWDMVPDLARLTVRSELTERSSADRHERRAEARRLVEERLASDPAWRWTRLMTGQIVDARLAFFRREAAEAAELLDRRERTKAALFRLGGIIRRVHLDMGRRLVDRGLLDEPGDIDLLDLHEIIPALQGAPPEPDDIAWRNGRRARGQDSAPLPRRFVGDPSDGADAKAEGRDGWSASPGTYEGLAVVLDEPRPGQMEPGDVLIAEATDAAWAPVFESAGAVVIEHGGPLSHAAIVARELGIPAVVNAAGIVERVRSAPDDVTIRVDGSSGALTLFDADGEPLDSPSSDPSTSQHEDDDGEPNDPEPGQDSGPAPGRGSPKSTATKTGVDRSSHPLRFTGLGGLSALQRRPPRWTEDPAMRLNVFVTGLIGAGAALAVLQNLVERLSTPPGRHALHRRAAPFTPMMATATVDGHEAAANSPTGLRDASWYRRVAIGLVVAAFALAALVVAAQAGDTREPDEAVTFGLGLSGATLLLGGAIVSERAARRWPRVPNLVRRWAPERPASPYGFWTAVGDPARRFAMGCITVVFVLAVAVTIRLESLQEIDEALYDAIGARENAERLGLDFLFLLGRPPVVIPLAIAIGLATFRCRIVAWAWPIAVVGGGVLNVMLGWITHRLRPELGAHAGEYTSFPGGHALQTTLILGLLPLAVHVMTGRRSARMVSEVVCALVWSVVSIDTVRTGGHWPSDQLAGFLLAAAAVVTIRSAARNPSTHAEGSTCPLVRPPERTKP